MHRAIWKERGLLTSHNLPIKYGPELTALLQTVPKPKTEAVIYLKGCQKDLSRDSRGNHLADGASPESYTSPDTSNRYSPSLLRPRNLGGPRMGIFKNMHKTGLKTIEVKSLYPKATNGNQCMVYIRLLVWVKRPCSRWLRTPLMGFT